MKKWIDEKGFLSKDYSLDKARVECQNKLEQERSKLLKNFQEGIDYNVSYEDDGKKTVYILNSKKAKKAYFSGPLIEGMKYKLEESEKGFSAQMVSPVFRFGKASNSNDNPKIELIDEGKDEKGESSTSQLDNEIESKKKKLDEEARLAEEKANELKRQAKDARRRKAELENFTQHQQFSPKK